MFGGGKLLDRPMTLRFPRQLLRRFRLDFYQPNYTIKEHLVNPADALQRAALVRLQSSLPFSARRLAPSVPLEPRGYQGEFAWRDRAGEDGAPEVETRVLGARAAVCDVTQNSPTTGAPGPPRTARARSAGGRRLARRDRTPRRGTPSEALSRRGLRRSGTPGESLPPRAGVHPKGPGPGGESGDSVRRRRGRPGSRRRESVGTPRFFGGLGRREDPLRRDRENGQPSKSRICKI